MRFDPKQVKNILVVRNDRFGEFLLNIPALRALKETFPRAAITVVIDPYVKELARGIEYIDAVIEWKKQKHAFMHKLKLIRLLRKKKIEIAVILNPSKEFNLIAFLAGIRIRIGYDRKWAFLLTHKMKDEKYLGQKHEVEYNLDLVKPIGAETRDRSLSLMTNEDLACKLFKGSDLSDKEMLVALHPFTSDPFKQWPYERFRALAVRIAQQCKVKVVVVGGIEHFQYSLELFRDVPEGIINLTGRTTLEQLSVLLTKCLVLITGDSGPMHLACAVNAPVIAIFRNDVVAKSPIRWGPWGEGNTVIQKSLLADISVEEVFAAAEALINEKRPLH
ncbi:MAG: glycosyltransferase family 9 protein [Candidatus Omnitrophota bacterium]|jgi:lipopolysaccharide heptosyltransferase II|nr:MAG: glycosyltransferase family 9 protein [Candidatus Omnitrophota bacterium]